MKATFLFFANLQHFIKFAKSFLVVGLILSLAVLWTNCQKDSLHSAGSVGNQFSFVSKTGLQMNYEVETISVESRMEQVNVGVQGAMRESCRQIVNDPNQGWPFYWTVLTQQERFDCWINETILQNVQIQEESDGVLHKTTQQFGNVLPARARVEARGANHEELLNHTGTTAAYNAVWRGAAGDFFITN